MTSGERPQRERVVLAHRRGARMVRTRVEVQEQTQVGDALVRGLVRAQLGLALRLAAVVVCTVVAIPLLNAVFPDLAAVTVFGIRLNWLILAVAGVSTALRRGAAVCAAGRTGRARLRPRRRQRTMTGAPLTAAALLAAAVATIAIGAYGVRLSRTTSDFLVASRTVGPQWNAAAISGEYLSAASFLGVAGLIAKYGADALWYPVGFTAGYLGLLLFVAAPLRRSGAYTVPDFAEFRLGSVRLRKVAMLVVVVICVFYLVPQYQGAGLALKTLLGVPVWIGPLVVGGIVITNVVAGGMRSITFVQAFQYWLKLTAIAIPALALLALFFTDRGELGGPLPPTVNQHTTVAIETDVVVQVADTGGDHRHRHARRPAPRCSADPVAGRAHPRRRHHPDVGRRCRRPRWWPVRPAPARNGSRRAADSAAAIRSIRCCPSSSRRSWARWGYRTCWCASTPTPTGGSPAARRWR